MLENRVYVLPFEPRTKKNSLVIAGTGQKCPVCGKPKKQWVRQGDAYNDYARKAYQWLLANYKWDSTDRPIDFPVNVQTVFYAGTRRKVDLVNLEEAVHDILVDAGILADDNSAIIASTDGSRVEYDKDNPRVEIYITRKED